MPTAVKFENPDGTSLYPSKDMMLKLAGFVSTLPAAQSATYKPYHLTNTDGTWLCTWVPDEGFTGPALVTASYYDRAKRTWVVGEKVPFTQVDDTNHFDQFPPVDDGFPSTDELERAEEMEFEEMEADEAAAIEELRKAAEEAAGQPVILTRLEGVGGLTDEESDRLMEPTPEDMEKAKDLLREVIVEKTLETAAQKPEAPSATGARQYHIYEYPESCKTEADRKKYRREWRKKHPGYAGSQTQPTEEPAVAPAVPEAQLPLFEEGKES